MYVRYVPEASCKVDDDLGWNNFSFNLQGWFFVHLDTILVRIHRRKFVGVIKKHDIPQYMGAAIRVHIYLIVRIYIYIIYIHDCTYIPVLNIGFHEMSALPARRILRCFGDMAGCNPVAGLREAMVNGGINLDSIPSRFLERTRQM